MIPDWTSTLLSGGAGAFIAAWFGAYLGFRRSKKERALDRRISWHESAIQSVAQYEEQLERLYSYCRNVLVVEGARNRPAGAEKPALPSHIKAPATLWNELREAENRARAALRVGDLYAEGEAQLDCALALTGAIDVVSSQWLDVSAEPMIPWVPLSQKAHSAGELRRSLQESLKVVLQLEGVLSRILGAKYRASR